MKAKRAPLVVALLAGVFAAQAEPISRLELAKGAASPTVVAIPAAGLFTLPVGRSQSNRWVFKDETVSRTHATVHCERRECTIEDTGSEGKGSSNGTFVNSVRLTPGKPSPLKPNDRIDLGPDAGIVAR